MRKKRTEEERKRTERKKMKKKKERLPGLFLVNATKLVKCICLSQPAWAEKNAVFHGSAASRIYRLIHQRLLDMFNFFIQITLMSWECYVPHPSLSHTLLLLVFLYTVSSTS